MQYLLGENWNRNWAIYGSLLYYNIPWFLWLNRVMKLDSWASAIVKNWFLLRTLYNNYMVKQTRLDFCCTGFLSTELFVFILSLFFNILSRTYYQLHSPSIQNYTRIEQVYCVYLSNMVLANISRSLNTVCALEDLWTWIKFIVQ